ncbi:MAG TPA: thiamine phosphate synthase [Verrucomicrobiae bacterium]|nr:thiamine phosphate synthase [Verrucomicrobiae bacterium]
MPSPQFDLYLVTDRRQTGGRPLLEVVERALLGGVKAVQLREKDLTGVDLFRLAEALKNLCLRHAAALFINDRVDVALAVDAEGVQLGGESMPIAAARELVGEKRFIGASVHSPAEAEAAERSGADFLVFGPVYFTPSKAGYGVPQGLERLQKLVEKISVPVYAIGGINSGNAAFVRKTGACGVALISAVMSAPDPAAAAMQILHSLKIGYE